ncbi:hypothetical protein XA68_12274 [Ophiocordyceps unilateralis]|uniref:Uridylate kinase n=1 Tax=Ophiocordyceps unilateralis TaxID=268505 RepID=A0A2A9PF30_OPHUN|nr:hypothetical protein XA68_12274 [Ophiocordyceps unilateralis]
MSHTARRQAVSIACTSFRSRPSPLVAVSVVARRLPLLPRRLLASSEGEKSSLSSSSSNPYSPNSSNNNKNHNNSYKARGSHNQTTNIKILPFIAIIAIGSAAYVALVNRRKAMPPAIDADHQQQQQQQQQLPPPASTSPAFSPDKATVVFVLGGPGAGKGTQCARLVAQYGFTHLSAGDLLRAEQDRPGSQFGDLIRSHIKDGLIVPMEVTVQLLENAMAEALNRPGPRPARFLIDGFPRKLDQAYRFEAAVCNPSLVLFYDCPENVMKDRLLERGKTSGRADDNAESILKRFHTFVETSMPVVDHYDKKGSVVKIDATHDPEAVYAETQKRLKEKLGDEF